jgi:hypothetical protein
MRNVVSDLALWLRRRGRRTLSQWRANNELASCPPGELRRIAAEVGVSTTDLRQLCQNHVGPSELLPQRLNMLGIDANYLQQEMPLTLRDLARVCSACQASRRCARDLARGDVEAGMASYCLNGATLDDMTLQPRRPSRT